MSQSVEYVIQTNNLSKCFGEVKALQSVDLAVPKNSVFGFLGPNGSGKTTFLKLLLGLCQPSAGTGTIFGYNITRDCVPIRERIGYLPQQPRFIEYMTARENLHFAAKFFFSGPHSKIKERCEEMLELVGLADKADRPIKGFSGGEKQRLGIALAQVNYPDLLILDEPASALDPLGRRAVLDIMDRLRSHTTIFYSTHILDDVQRVSDTVAILNHGRLEVCGSIEQILNRNIGDLYKITTKGKPGNMEKHLARFNWIRNIQVTQHNGSSVWQVSVNDQKIAERDLLRIFIEEKELTVTEFSRKKFDLEEIFIQTVKGDENGS